MSGGGVLFGSQINQKPNVATPTGWAAPSAKVVFFVRDLHGRFGMRVPSPSVTLDLLDSLVEVEPRLLGPGTQLHSLGEIMLRLTRACNWPFDGSPTSKDSADGV